MTTQGTPERVGLGDSALRRRQLRSLIVVLVTLMVLAFVACTLSALQLRSAGVKAEADLSRKMEQLVVMQSLHTANERSGRKLTTYLVTREPRDRAAHFAARERLDTLRAQLRALDVEGMYTPMIDEVDRLDRLLDQRSDRLVSSVAAATPAEEARRQFLEAGTQAARDRLDAQLNALVGRYDDDVLRLREDARRTTARAFWRFILAAAVGAALGLSLAALLLGVAQALRRTAADVARRASEYEALAESMPQVVWTANPRGEIDYISQRLPEFSGASIEETLGTNWAALVHPDDLPTTLQRWNASVASGQPYSTEHRVRNADGAYRWRLDRAVSFRDGDGKVAKWFGSSTDIQELKDSREQAVAALKLRDDFLVVAAHELRTPLTAIKLQLANLKRVLGEEAPPVLPRVERLEGQLNRLGKLIENVVGIGMLEEIAAQPSEPLDLADTSRAVCDSLRTEFERTGTRFEVLSSGTVRADLPRRALEQVLSHLISNAIKFAPGTRVVLRVWSEGGAAMISVTDQGVGISPEAQAQLFAKFERAVPTANYGGLGLGLYVARRLTTLMGGSLSLSSTVGVGTTFVVRLPRAPGVDLQLPAAESVLH